MVDGPRGVSVVAGHATAFPVGAGARRDVRSRSSSARRRGDRRRGPRQGANVHPRADDEHAAPSALGPRAGDLRRGPVPPRRDGRGVRRRRAAARDRERQALRAATRIEDTRFDVERRRSTSARCARSTCRTSGQIVRAGTSASVMSAYNRVNGSTAPRTPHLLRDVLKGEWGFAGFVESDWILGTRSTVPSLTAGLDIEMPVRRVLRRAAADGGRWRGRCREAIIDEAVRRILRAQLCFRLDTDPPSASTPIVAEPRAPAPWRARGRRARASCSSERGGALPLDRASVGSWWSATLGRRRESRRHGQQHRRAVRRS